MQLMLANKLEVSDKAVSKWENRQGYPDITLFPRLADLFGVTIDYLILGEKKWIAIAGSIIADIVKNIDIYPEKGMMAYVSDITYAVGGCVPNTAINLAKIDPSIPINVFGKVGTDESGDVRCKYYAILPRFSISSDKSNEVIQKFETINESLQETMYRELGVNILWIDDFEEVPEIIKKIKNI